MPIAQENYTTCRNITTARHKDNDIIQQVMDSTSDEKDPTKKTETQNKEQPFKQVILQGPHCPVIVHRHDLSTLLC